MNDARVVAVGLASALMLLHGSAVAQTTSDAYLASDGTLLLVSGVNGSRTVVSSTGADQCQFAAAPYPCCTGPGTGEGTGLCVQVGAGPVGLSYDGLAPLANGTTILAGVSYFGSFGELGAIMAVDVSSGDRTFVAANDLTDACQAVGDPFACCTGLGTGDGTGECSATGIGSGPDVPSETDRLEAVPFTPPTVASLPVLGLTALVGVLLGLGIKSARGQGASRGSSRIGSPSGVFAWSGKDRSVQLGLLWGQKPPVPGRHMLGNARRRTRVRGTRR